MGAKPSKNHLYHFVAVIYPIHTPVIAEGVRNKFQVPLTTPPPRSESDFSGRWTRGGICICICVCVCISWLTVSYIGSYADFCADPAPTSSAANFGNYSYTLSRHRYTASQGETQNRWISERLLLWKKLSVYVTSITSAGQALGRWGSSRADCWKCIPFAQLRIRTKVIEST